MEREAQLRVAEGYVADADAGHGRLVFVAGEAGVGKTAFLERLRTGAGVRSATGWCDGTTTPPPLGPLVDMLPDLPPGVWSEGASRQEVFARLLAALRDRTGPPFLLVVEDAHWADEATLDLLRHLARRIHTCRAVVMVSFRPEDAAPHDGLRLLLGDTASATGTRRIDLSPLSLDGVRTLVGATGGTEVDVVELHRLTGGNAFFVTEAISAETDGLPPTVRDAVLARVLRLTDVERQGLDVVALCGARAETQVLERVLTDGLRTLDGPLARGLLRRVGTDIVFRHELARLAVVGEIPTGRAVHIHRRLLAVLRDQDTDPARVAHHAEAAGDAAAVLAAAPAAGARAAEMGAHQEAARQYQRALGCADRLAPADRAELLWSLGYELYLTGHIDGAIDVMTRARTIWEAAGETVRVGDAWRCQSRLHWFAGRHDAALDDAERAVALLDGSESVEQALALSHRAGLEMLGSNLAGTRRWSAPALELLDRLPDDSRREAVRVHALNNLGTMEIVAGDLADG